MEKFWYVGTVGLNSAEIKQKENAREFVEAGGIVNDAFDDDEFNMPYTQWKNLGVIRELEDSVINKKGSTDEAKKEVFESQDSEHDSCSKPYSVTETEDTVTEESQSDFEDPDPVSLLARPDGSVSRLIMIQRLTAEHGSLGSMCQEDDCPYNKWLYRGHKFPEDKIVKNWERENKDKDKSKKDENFHLENFSLPRVILSKNKSRSKSTFSPYSQQSFLSNSFHYSRSSEYPFAFPNRTASMYLPPPTPPHLQTSGPPTPSTAPLPPYSWSHYKSSPNIYSPSTANMSISSNYPIVTLPKSERKSKRLIGPKPPSSKHKSKSSPLPSIHFSALCCGAKDRSETPIFYMRQKYPQPSVNDIRPSSPSSTTSCSCTSSSCSSCSTCINIPIDPREPHAFTQDTRYNSAPKKRFLPRCDLTCCVIISFILVSMAGLAALLLYLYLFTPVMMDTGEI